MVNRLLARRIRVIAMTGSIPRGYQWDRIHFNAEAHAKIAARLAAQITAPPNLQVARSAEMISRYDSSPGSWASSNAGVRERQR